MIIVRFCKPHYCFRTNKIYTVPVFDLRSYFTDKKTLVGEDFDLVELIKQAPLWTKEVPDASLVGVVHGVAEYVKDGRDIVSHNLHGVLLFATST